MSVFLCDRPTGQVVRTDKRYLVQTHGAQGFVFVGKDETYRIVDDRLALVNKGIGRIAGPNERNNHKLNVTVTVVQVCHVDDHGFGGVGARNIAVVLVASFRAVIFYNGNRI